MAIPKTQNLTMVKGSDFFHTVRWETEPVVFKAITGITQAAPARVTCSSHGLTSGWSVAVVSVKGMTQINAANSPPKSSDFIEVSVVDANTVDLVGVNAAGYKAYISGGYLQFNTAKSLSGYTARMSIKDKVDGTELLRLDTSNGRIVIDDATKVIELDVPAVIMEAITWKKGVYDLEMVSLEGVVTSILTGTVTVLTEVTTT
jgi:hypothetical protein